MIISHIGGKILLINHCPKEEVESYYDIQELFDDCIEVFIFADYFPSKGFMRPDVDWIKESFYNEDKNEMLTKEMLDYRYIFLEFEIDGYTDYHGEYDEDFIVTNYKCFNEWCLDVNVAGDYVDM